ncbi:hypothetical protein [Sorangium sp. So ce204]|uniref:hypothetical protein n=2 Tax=unclassified Sorangium TaxID=2621164 RepID=UPI003F63F50C
MPGDDMPLPPTSQRLLDPDAVPYFLWDLGITVAEARRILAREASPTRDDLIARILREANSRDVWTLLDWPAIEEAWPRVVHRLGRARGVWTMMLERRREHVRTTAAA